MDILTREGRKKLLNYIQSEENNERKAISLKQSEIYNDRLFQYVREELLKSFEQDTVNEMPVASFINFPKRIVDQEASIYRDEPMRSFMVGDNRLNDDAIEKLNNIYDLMEVNSKNKNANQKFKLQDQTHIMIVPVNGELKVRCLYLHQLDAIPNAKNPEIADAYIISSFDKERYLNYQNSQNATGNSVRSTSSNRGGTGLDMPIADKEDYKKALEYYVYWDKEYNFVFNGKGEIIDPSTREPLEQITDDDILSPIPGTIPIIDVSKGKDFEYFVRSGMSVTDFGVQYNAAISDTWHNVRMQGYSIATLIAPAETMPSSLSIGPNKILRIVTKPTEGINRGEIDFSFNSPSPDIQSALKLIETMLVNFMASRGLDPREIATDGSKTYNSALERMLAMIDEFEATKDDFKVFKRVETQLFEIIKAWLKNAQDQLNAEFRVELPEDTKINVKFSEPQLVQTKSEKLSYWEKRIENGLASRSDALMDIEGISRSEAEVRLLEIDGVDNGEAISSE